MNNYKEKLKNILKSEQIYLNDWEIIILENFIENLLEETKKEAFNDWVKYAVDYKVTFIDENTDLEDLDMEEIPQFKWTLEQLNNLITNNK